MHIIPVQAGRLRYNIWNISFGISESYSVHPASAYRLVKKAFHTLDAAGGHPGPPLQKFPHPGPLPEGEGIRGLISPVSPIEGQPDLLDEKYALAG